ncbi:MAG TPA: 2-oxoglutarate dehydrogenase complex dihydrolipoyllysine-residue succinyltransferase [Geminicoccaceae bacterium]|jgi:2-oxoglutarate dehydrogenase E2 component (dihydrolipoamide succinyltransferase)|nr:2-oxoglutarate dehydrogenase complex dihydrolipoyllysine-residue succinyltransferase [Geminicoccaceae bacterium]
MSVEIRVPSLGESVTEATVARWFKQIGDPVAADEPLVELETDKVTLEFNAPASGVLAEIAVEAGGEVEVGALLGSINEEAVAAAPAKPRTSETQVSPGATQAPPGEAQARPVAAEGNGAMAPAVRKLIDEHGLDPSRITPTGPKGNITKGDVLAAIEALQAGEAGAAARREADFGAAAAEPQARAEVREVRAQDAAGPTPAAAPAVSARAQPAPAPEPAVSARAQPAPSPERKVVPHAGRGREERVRMTRLRRRIAERLKEAQNTAAILTTYNEADLGAVMELRQRYRDDFEKKHGVRLGFMSFFVKASINALQAFPAVNAEIDGDEIVYKHYYDIGVAVSAPSGLVVPVVRNADQLSFAEIEKAINELGARARDGRLAMEELVGGTFTISNGGVYGSLMSAPILNPPQVGILGMHKIQERPVAIDGEIKVRPMMYLALSYDHRIVDGREAVSFLVRIKECIEDPERLLLDV